MASTLRYHHVLTDGVGKCSVPVWSMGAPAGFCDAPAYGERQANSRYTGYVPGLACPNHGGPYLHDKCPFGCSRLAWNEREQSCSACGFTEEAEAKGE